jgi:YYY domain-containing protein
VLFFPFHADYQNFVSGIGTVTVPTEPFQFVTLFGIWLFLMASFLLVELHDRLEGERFARGLPASGRTLRLWTLLGIGLLVLAIAYLLSLKALLLLLIGVGLYLALDTKLRPDKLMIYIMLLFALMIALGVEFIYVRDFLDGSAYERMNTVFKFYYQVWTLFALSGALIFAQLIGRAGRHLIYAPSRSESPPDRPPSDQVPAEEETAADALPGGDGLQELRRVLGLDAVRSVWIVLFIGILLGSSIFLVSGTGARVNDPQIWADVQPPPGGIQPTGLSLDGMAYMRGWYPGDYSAINWINAHIAGDPTIVEASDGNYNWYGRVSIYTGLPDVLGWGSREYEQRYGDEVFSRQSDVQSFWETSDPNAALGFLHQYHVQYVYVGQLERTCYIMNQSSCVPMPAGALAKLDTLRQANVLRIVYQNSSVVLYKVVG